MYLAEEAAKAAPELIENGTFKLLTKEEWDTMPEETRSVLICLWGGGA